MSAGRRRYLVAYDIREDKRLRRVHKAMKGYGWSMQYSVFVCDLDDMELVEMKMQLAELIHHGVDSIAIVNLGDPTDRGVQCFTFMGHVPALPVAGPVIL